MIHCEVSYMVDGCGKKIQSTRTVLVYDGDVLLGKEKTQENIEEVRKKYEKIIPPRGND